MGKERQTKFILVSQAVASQREREISFAPVAIVVCSLVTACWGGALATLCNSSNRLMAAVALAPVALMEEKRSSSKVESENKRPEQASLAHYCAATCGRYFCIANS